MHGGMCYWPIYLLFAREKWKTFRWWRQGHPFGLPLRKYEVKKGKRERERKMREWLHHFEKAGLFIVSHLQLSPVTTISVIGNKACRSPLSVKMWRLFVKLTNDGGILGLVYSAPGWFCARSDLIWRERLIRMPVVTLALNECLPLVIKILYQAYHFPL